MSWEAVAMITGACYAEKLLNIPCVLSVGRGLNLVFFGSASNFELLYDQDPID